MLKLMCTLIVMFLPPVGSPPGGIESIVPTIGAPVILSQTLKLSPISKEYQSGTASVTVTVVVQCDVSQGDSCGEYEQQLLITPSIPHNKKWLYTPYRIGASVRIAQFKLITIAVGIYDAPITTSWWIPPTVGTGTLSSADRVIMIGIL